MRSQMVSAMNKAARAWIGIWMVLLSWAMWPSFVRAEDPAPEKVGGYVTVSAANERSTLDRDTRVLTSEVDLTLSNPSAIPIAAPLHAVFDILGVPYESVQMPGALGGAGTGPYGKYYHDLSPLLADDLLSPGEAVTLHAVFTRAATVVFQYNVVPYGVPETTPINRPPTLQPIEDREIQEGQFLEFQITGSDPDGDPLNYGAQDLPSGAAVSPATGAFSWTPGFDQSGSYQITFYVSDGQASAQQTVSVQVIDINRPPVISTLTIPPGRIDQFYDVKISAADPDADPLTFTLVQGPAGMEIGAKTGGLTWRPGLSAIGAHAVTVQVGDGRGGSDSKSYVLSVPDTIPPGVYLHIPTEVLPGKAFTATVQAEDNLAVASIELDGIRQDFSPLERAVTIQREMTAPSDLGGLVLTAKAWDPSGNMSEVPAYIMVSAAFDTTPPEVDLAAPAQAAPGQTILLSARAADNAGVATVTFFANGSPIGTLPGMTPVMSYAVPGDAAAGTEIPFRAVASDFSGNSAADDERTLIVSPEQADTTAPEPEVETPEEVREDETLPLTTDVPNEPCLSRIDVYVNHTLAATFVVPEGQVFDVPLPTGVEAGMEVLVEVVVTDCSGNVTRETRDVYVSEMGKGVIAGEVYNDSTGLALAGANVALLPSRGEPVVAVTDAKGRYAFEAKAGPGRLTVSKEGCTSVERTGLMITDAEGIEALDARLTPLDAPQPAVSAVLGGKLSTPFSIVRAGFVPALLASGLDPSSVPPGEIELRIPGGALQNDRALTLTQISPQGLQGVLPGGWSPVGAVDLSPHGILFQDEGSLSLPNALDLEAETKIVLAAWDETAQAWRAVSEAALSQDGLRLGAQVNATGQYAFLLPDPAPQSPPAAVIGELLQGATMGLLPQDAAMVITPEPRILFYQPGVHSDVGVRVSSGSSPLSSGTPVLVRVEESYRFYSEEEVHADPFVQDIILYGMNRSSLTAAFPVTPGMEFEALALEEGVISLDAFAPTDPARGTAVMGPQGGIVTTQTGEALLFPAGAVSAMTPVILSGLDEDGLAVDLPQSLAYVGGVSVSFSGARLALPAALSVPLPQGFVDQGQIVLVRLLDVDGATRLLLVGVGRVQGNTVVSGPEPAGEVSFEEISSGGRYFFVQTEAGFVHGKVLGTDGLPLAGALITADTHPLSALSGSEGRYAAAVAPGAFVLTALDPVKKDQGTASGTMPQAGDFLPLDLSLEEEPPRVISVTPADGAVNVALATAVMIQFSEPLDPATVTAENVVLNGPEGPVPGTLTLTANNSLVTLRPSEPLAPNTAYSIGISEEILDLAGHALGIAFVSGFTSLDTEPPPAPPAGNINAPIPGDDGRTTVTGTQGTAGVHDTVTIVNQTTNVSTPVLVEPDGSFNVRIDAGMLDKLVISIKDPAGNETVVPVGAFRNPDGSTVVGPEGGLLDAENGVVLDIPAGAFPKGAIVKLTALTKGDIGLDPGPEFPFVAAFDVECSEPPHTYMNASAPVAAGTAEGKRGIVARRAEIYSGPVLAIVDTATVVDGRLTTSSPPCPGILARVGRYAMFLNENQQMAMGEALLSMVAPSDRSSVISPLIKGMAAQYSAWFPAYADVFKGVAYGLGGPASSEYAGEAYSELYRQICMPVPADAPLKVVVRDADSGDLIDVFDVDPIEPGAHADITYQDPEDVTPPKVIGIEPIQKVLNPGNRVITIRFSEPITPDSAQTVALAAQGDDQTLFDGEFELSDNNRVLRFLPSVPLPLGRNYRLVLDWIRDLNGNRFSGFPLYFRTFVPFTVFPTKDARLDQNKIANDTGLNPQGLPQDLWFVDVDFITRPPEKSGDGKWHTDLFAIQAGEGSGGQSRLFNINADDPASPVVVGAFATDPRYLQRRVRILDDVSLAPRPDASTDPQFWKTRELHYREDDPSIRICAAAGSPEIAAWRAVFCEDPEDPKDCGVLLGGCGDLAVTVVDNTKYGYLWSYDVTERNNVRWASSRMLNDNGTKYGFPRYYEAPAGLGTGFGLEVVTGLDIAHGDLVHENTVGVYAANYGIGVELVDLGLNLPTINSDDRKPGSPDAWAKSEALKINAQLYYRDVAFVRGKAVAIAGQLGTGAGVRTLEIFRPDLAGEPLAVVPLVKSPGRLVAVADFPVSGVDPKGPVLKDLAFITSQDGGITVAEIPKALEDVNAAQIQANTNTIPTPQGVSTKGIQVDRAGTTAYVAASGVQAGVAGDHILVVDVSRPFSASTDEDQDGWDDRIVGKVPVALHGYHGPVYVHGFRLDAERGLIYAGLYAGGNQGLAIIKVRECPDLGVDFKAKPLPQALKTDLERMALQKVISTALAQCDHQGVTMIEQGSGACIWKNECGADYQPFVSDHDFEVFFPRGTAQETIDCVIEGLYTQVVDEASDPVPVEVQGYLVTFDNISFFPMVREEFEEALLNIDPPENDQGDVTGDMGLGRQQLLLKWIVEGTYVQVPGLDLEGRSFSEILAELRKPMDVDGDGTEDEPSRIPRLEGYEWAKFQESELYASGALLRIHGASEEGTTLHQGFKKDLHKVAKAAIRAVLARIVADDTGNLVALDLSAQSPTCIDASDDDEPLTWELVPCDSFAHHIASAAARLVRDHRDSGVFTVDEVQDLVYRFYRVKAGKEEISSDEEADAFIAAAVNFILSVGDEGGEAKDIYDRTIGLDPRQDQRRQNMNAVLQRIGEVRAKGQKQIIPRFYNEGGEDAKGIAVRMYVEGRETAKERVDLPAGEIVHLDTRKEPRPAPGDAEGTKRKNVPVFSVEADQAAGGDKGWITFLVDLPDKKADEPDRRDNRADVFYYVLDPGNPAAPALTEVPDIQELVQLPEQEALSPDLHCICQGPKLRIVQSINGVGSPDEIIPIYRDPSGGEVCFNVDVTVENLTGEDLTDIRIISMYGAGWEVKETLDWLPAGGTHALQFSSCAPEDRREDQGQVFVSAKPVSDPEAEFGLGSDLLNLRFVCPIALVAPDPDPNPEKSQVMYGGAFARYYRAVDLRTMQPLVNADVLASFNVGDAFIQLFYKTDEDGDIFSTKEETDGQGNVQQVPVKGLWVPWKVWVDAGSPPLPTPVEGRLEVRGSCSAPVVFEVIRSGLAFEESVKAGATASWNAGLGIVKGTLREGSNIDISGSGCLMEQQTTFDKLSLTRRGTSYKNADVSFKFELFKAKIGKGLERLTKEGGAWKVEVEGPSVGAEWPILSYTGNRYDFPLVGSSLDDLSRLQTAGIFLYSLMSSPPPDSGLANYRLLNQVFTAATADPQTTFNHRQSWILGQWLLPKVGAELFTIKASVGGAEGGPGSIRLKADLSASVGLGLGISFEDESFKRIWAPLEIPGADPGTKKTVMRESVVGEFSAEAGLAAGLQTQLNKAQNEKEEAYIKAQHGNLLSAGAGISNGIKMAMTMDVDKGYLPESLDVTFSGKKDYGVKLMDNDLISWGDGSQSSVTYSIKDLKKIKEIAQELSDYSVLLDNVRKNQLNLQEFPEVKIGPTMLLLKFMDFLFLLRDDAEIWMTKEKGTAVSHPVAEASGKVFGIGLGSRETLKADHAVSYITKRGVILNSDEYFLEDYSTIPQEPALGALKAVLDQINASTAEQADEAFDTVERGFDEGTQTGEIRSAHSSRLRLQGRQDYDAVAGLLSFAFEAVPGPFAPYYYAPEDMMGSADKPHYGIGGFHEYYPLGTTLAQPATLILDYYDEEIAGLDEGGLAIYRWNSLTLDWEHVGGERDPENNTITTQITTLGAYTIAPPMPAGRVLWEAEQAQQVGENIRLSLTSEPLTMNNGAPVSDGTVFHVQSALPFAHQDGEPIPFGTVLTPDARADMAGWQVAVENGRIRLDLEFPGLVSGAAKVIVFSDVGTAFTNEIVSLATP